MKEIYLVVTHAVCDLVDNGVSTQVFSTYDKAKEAFDAYVCSEMDYIAEYEGWIVEEDEDRFEAWEDGRYCENHTFGEIRKEFLSSKDSRSELWPKKVFTQEQLDVLADCILAQISAWAKVGEGVQSESLNVVKMVEIGKLRTMLDYINEGRKE